MAVEFLKAWTLHMPTWYPKNFWLSLGVPQLGCLCSGQPCSGLLLPWVLSSVFALPGSNSSYFHLQDYLESLRRSSLNYSARISSSCCCLREGVVLQGWTGSMSSSRSLLERVVFSWGQQRWCFSISSSLSHRCVPRPGGWQRGPAVCFSQPGGLFLAHILW